MSRWLRAWIAGITTPGDKLRCIQCGSESPTGSYSCACAAPGQPCPEILAFCGLVQR